MAYLLTYTGNGQAIYLCGTTLITNRINDYIHENERYFWQEASPSRCSRVLHSVVVGMWGCTNYRRAVRNLDTTSPNIFFKLSYAPSIVYRALQSIGGSGLYSLAMASVLEIAPLKYIGHTSAGVAIANACASILGPIVDGAITSGTTWRCVFWLKYVLLSFIKSAQQLMALSSIPGGSIIINVRLPTEYQPAKDRPRTLCSSRLAGSGAVPYCFSSTLLRSRKRRDPVPLE